MLAFLASTSLFVLILILLGVSVIHFLPIIVAGSRHVRNFWWIVLINVLFGWTGIGWIVALVWAFSDQPAYRVGYMAGPPPQF
jgi:hypothetical protein